MGAALIKHYFPDLSEKQMEQLGRLKELYEEWNARINVISRKDMDQFYVHHVLHALAIGRYVRFKDYTEIMDAGTGGGFPGIPLAILFPGARFWLVDSIGKKIKVVQEVADALGLTNVTAMQARMEQVDRTFDFIVSRAVTNMGDFVRWTGYKFHQQSFNDVTNGIIYLKGGDLKEEMRQVKGFKYKIIDLPDYFEEPFFETKKIVHLFKK